MSLTWKEPGKFPQENLRSLECQWVERRAGMIPVLRSRHRYQIYGQLSARLDPSRAENARWQLADAVYSTTASVIADD